MKLRYLLALLLLLLPACTDSGAMPMTMLSGGVSSAVGDGWVGFGSETGDDMLLDASRLYWTPYTSTTAGNVRYGHIWLVDGNSRETCVSLHSADGTKLLSASDTMTDDTEGWVVFDMGESYELAAATSYLLTIDRSGGDIYVGRTTEGPDVVYANVETYSCGQAITLPPGLTPSSAYSLTIVFDNTSDAAPSTP